MNQDLDDILIIFFFTKFENLQKLGEIDLRLLKRRLFKIDVE